MLTIFAVLFVLFVVGLFVINILAAVGGVLFITLDIALMFALGIVGMYMVYYGAVNEDFDFILYGLVF